MAKSNRVTLIIDKAKEGIVDFGKNLPASEKDARVVARIKKLVRMASFLTSNDKNRNCDRDLICRSLRIGNSKNGAVFYRYKKYLREIFGFDFDCRKGIRIKTTGVFSRKRLADFGWWIIESNREPPRARRKDVDVWCGTTSTLQAMKSALDD
jgi:hypothetical protein